MPGSWPGEPQQAVFRVQQRAYSVVASSGDGFFEPRLAASNDLGAIAFDDQYGAYIGNDPVSHGVLRVGDALDGSTVTSVRGRDYNNQGELALQVTLEDGRDAIFRASPQP